MIPVVLRDAMVQKDELNRKTVVDFDAKHRQAEVCRMLAKNGEFRMQTYQREQESNLPQTVLSARYWF